ncbi:FAD-dependent oxidoreductase [Vibrio sp. WXL210]|uniref:FAD-dependent oxidoreductase n=1 Tax=Vibrio sp. WXL210 TaxID=3450709 RepID=UPI003EC57DD7
MNSRTRKEQLEFDFVVVGGGLPGVCTALAAARAGIKVALVQDRPVLGGNSSSEVRVWALGATAHMDSNHKWSREGGVVNEILVENNHRNPDGNSYIYDDILLEKVLAEPNLSLFLNTAISDVETHNDQIVAVLGYNSSNETRYEFQAKLYSDCSGDGILGFAAGADFIDVPEKKELYNETMVRDESYGDKLGSSLMFEVEECGKEVHYTPPGYIYDDITCLPRYKDIKLLDEGCHFWWLEYGGRLDTIHENETIKFELRKALFTTWNYIKNSGKFPEAKTKNLAWVGSIPGKRQGRRFLGDYVLNQHDVMNAHNHPDNVAYGGWSIDLHPADGMFSNYEACFQWHMPTIYPIPFRCLYSRNISNLMIGGRLTSVSHIAFGSTRVMLTGALCGQASGVAAAVCVENNLLPKDIIREENLEKLHVRLMRTGQFVPNILPKDQEDLVQSATLKSSSSFKFTGLTHQGEYFPLNHDYAVLMPVPSGQLPAFTVPVRAQKETAVDVRVFKTKGPGYTPSFAVFESTLKVQQGESSLHIEPNLNIESDEYIYIAFNQNSDVEVGASSEHISSIITVYRGEDDTQTFDAEYNIPDFTIWRTQRLPYSNIAISFDREVDIFPVSHVKSFPYRPTTQSNCWVDRVDAHNALHLEWEQSVELKDKVLTLHFDSDLNQSLETLKPHKFNAFPCNVKSFEVIDQNGAQIHKVDNNYQSIVKLPLNCASTDKISIRVLESWGSDYFGIFGITIH